MTTTPPDDLTPAQTEELHQRLLTLQEECRKALTTAKDDTQPIDLDLPIGRVSRIDAIQQQKMAQANRRNLELRLKQIDAALSCVKREEYGYCRRCEDPIGYPRLKARPETPFCLSCQHDLEQR